MTLRDNNSYQIPVSSLYEAFSATGTTMGTVRSITTTCFLLLVILVCLLLFYVFSSVQSR